MDDKVTVSEKDGQVQVAVEPKAVEPHLELEPLKGFLDADSEDLEDLKRIYQYFHEEDMKPSQLLMAIRNVESRMSTPKLGQTRVSQIVRFISADRAVKEAESARDAYLR